MNTNVTVYGYSFSNRCLVSATTIAWNLNSLFDTDTDLECYNEDYVIGNNDNLNTNKMINKTKKIRL